MSTRPACTAPEHRMNATSHPRADAAVVVQPRPSGPVVLDSQELLRGHSVVAITHNGALYRLQTTRQGKLILTK